ncbi:MAG TPA: hypothetical protein PLJ12_01105, partial [Planctomycetota bacterium]|nr:hypothetical protein [Planctomycetota bacterium]
MAYLQTPLAGFAEGTAVALKLVVGQRIADVAGIAQQTIEKHQQHAAHVVAMRGQRVALHQHLAAADQFQRAALGGHDGIVHDDGGGHFAHAAA